MTTEFAEADTEVAVAPYGVSCERTQIRTLRLEAVRCAAMAHRNARHAQSVEARKPRRSLALDACTTATRDALLALVQAAEKVLPRGVVGTTLIERAMQGEVQL
jgi:hypothetical protein